MDLEIVQVDAFTDRPFAGNPAAVCVTEAPLPEAVMQSIAAEMNLSETAFLTAIEGGYSLRWFTPKAEVDLCGHATLASAHTLWHQGHLPAGETARFNTKSGWLSATQKGDWIELDFPAQPAQPASHVLPQLISSLCCGGNVRGVYKTETNYLVELQSQRVVQNLQPDFAKLAKLPVQGVIVTAAADDDTYDFVSRYFAPAVGIDEDPVTGSAHTSLAPYWQEKLDKTEMLAQQISPRGGVIKVACTGAERVKISGQAIAVLKGTLSV